MIDFETYSGGSRSVLKASLPEAFFMRIKAHQDGTPKKRVEKIYLVNPARTNLKASVSNSVFVTLTIILGVLFFIYIYSENLKM